LENRLSPTRYASISAKNQSLSPDPFSVPRCFSSYS
jgi:hypothetical protein